MRKQALDVLHDEHRRLKFGKDLHILTVQEISPILERIIVFNSCIPRTACKRVCLTWWTADQDGTAAIRIMDFRYALVEKNVLSFCLQALDILLHRKRRAIAPDKVRSSQARRFHHLGKSSTLLEIRS